MSALLALSAGFLAQNSLILDTSVNNVAMKVVNTVPAAFNIPLGRNMWPAAEQVVVGTYPPALDGSTLNTPCHVYVAVYNNLCAGATTQRGLLNAGSLEDFGFDALGCAVTASSLSDNIPGDLPLRFPVKAVLQTTSVLDIRVPSATSRILVFKKEDPRDANNNRLALRTTCPPNFSGPLPPQLKTCPGLPALFPVQGAWVPPAQFNIHDTDGNGLADITAFTGTKSISDYLDDFKSTHPPKDANIFLYEDTRRDKLYLAVVYGKFAAGGLAAKNWGPFVGDFQGAAPVPAVVNNANFNRNNGAFTVGPWNAKRQAHIAFEVTQLPLSWTIHPTTAFGTIYVKDGSGKTELMKTHQDWTIESV